MSRTDKPIETECRLVIPGAGGGENGKQLLNEYRVSLWGDENILELDRDGGCSVVKVPNGTELCALND